MAEETAVNDNPVQTPEADAALSKRIAELEAELAQGKDQLLRALAEQENARRRIQRDKEEALRYAASTFAKDLLSTADNLRRALDSVASAEIQDEAVKTLIVGIEATERELLSAFERNGLKRVDPLGQKFDHNLHQALFEVESSGKPAGTVVQVLAPGYTLHDRLLRAAMVGVAKGEPAGEAGSRRLDTTA